MNVDTELLDALRTLRSLDLPAPRLAYLQRVLIHAPFSADRQRILRDARNEEARNAYAAQRATEKAWADKKARDALRGAQKPRKCPTKVTDEHRAKVREMRAEGATLKVISEAVGIAESAVSRVLSADPEPRSVIPAKKLKKWTPEPLPEDDPRHGTSNGYMNYGCRCQPCVDARKAYRERLKANPAGRAARSEHGTTSKYARGCRCDQCRAAVTDAAREYRERKRQK
jgi:hypothetical protein